MQVSAIDRLPSLEPDIRSRAAEELFQAVRDLMAPILAAWRRDADLSALLRLTNPAITAGIAVLPENFEKIRTANGNPHLADIPPDQDAREFELHFGERVHLDILTTKDPHGNGVIARFLGKFGEGIQQVEIQTSDCDQATNRIRSTFGVEPIYPATRPGADGTRVNFFLASRPDGRKILVEFVEKKSG
jgi:hypothetical protein